MRINIVMGFFLPLPALSGGAMEKIWLRLGELFAAAGHDVTLVSRRWPGLPHDEQLGRLRHIRLPGFNHTRFLPVNLALDLLWGLRVARALPPGDVVVCNTVTLPIYLRRVRPSAGRVAVVLGRMPKGQVRAYGGVDSVFATSEAVAARARRENPGLGDRIFTIPNSIDWSLHAAAAAQSAPTAPLTIGYVGRIHPEKGLEQLLNAAVLLRADPALPSWRLRLIGPADIPRGGGGEAYRDALLSHYLPLLGRCLEILPPVFDAPALASHYGSFNIFCYPSLAAQGEGLSVAPIEAMAAGAVPVVSRLDCYRDLISPRLNGFQFDHAQAHPEQELAAHLRRLLTDPALRRSLAAQAQADARRFDHAEVARAVLAEFTRLTTMPPPVQAGAAP